MSDKERLGAIKEARKRILDEKSFQKKCIFLNSFEELGYLDWLIEQAEKAEKYREALEFYADKEIYEPVLISEAQCIDGNWVEPASYEPPTVYFDKGEIARKVLEGKMI